MLTIVALSWNSLAIGQTFKAASASNWIRVADTDVRPLQNEVPSGAANSTYLTVRVNQAVLRAGDGWWTRFISTSKKLGVVARVTIPGGTDQVVYSEFIDVLQNDDFQFGDDFSVIREQPIGRKDFHVTLSLVAEAQDGAAEMLNELKGIAPVFGIAYSDQVVAGIGLGKKLIDAFLGRELLKDALRSRSELGKEIESGIYVIFAARRKEDYRRYETSPLIWRNGVLYYQETSGAKLPVPKVSYMVVRVAHVSSLYPTPDTVFLAEAKWARVYDEARRKVVPLELRVFDDRNPDDVLLQYKRMQSELNLLLQKASILIDEDGQLTKGERIYLAETMMVNHFRDALAQKKSEAEKKAANVQRVATSAIERPEVMSDAKTAQLLSLPGGRKPTRKDLEAAAAHSEAISRQLKDVQIRIASPRDLREPNFKN